MTADVDRGSPQPRQGISPRRLPTGERILIVDDDDALLSVLLEVLDSEGYRCRGAENAAAGHALLARDSFDLVICDLGSGDEDVAFLDEVERGHPETALLMACEDPRLAQLAGEHGVSGYLIKPIREEEVLANVACALGLARRRQNAAEARSAVPTATIERLSALVARRDFKNGIHTCRVGEFAALIGGAAGLSEETVHNLRHAAPMHDIGKLALPDSILRKPGPLSAAERSLMQRHAEIGHELLAGTGSPLLDLAAEIALTHHERFDGSGYPHGMKGFEIPLSGRIVSIADVYDALTSDRPYREAVSSSRAIEAMFAERGTHFDPTLLDRFRRELEMSSGRRVEIDKS
jgi:putative two-component system response regulator